MANFIYQASNNIGESIKGILVADDVEHLEKMLADQGLYLLQAQEKQATVSFTDRFRKSAEDSLLFTIQMATGLKSGLPLIEVIDDMMEEAEGYFKKVLQDIKINVEAGNSLSDALRLYPNIFSEIYRVIVRTGEESGKIDQIFDYLVYLLEWEKDLKKQIKKAITPIIGILFMLAGLMVLVLTVVLPNFVGVFSSAGVQLPLPTLILLATGDFFTNYWWAVLGGIIGTYVGFKVFRSTEAGGMMWDKFILSTPVIGTLVLKIAMSRFANFWKILFSSGVDLARSLEITSEVVNNKKLEKGIKDARNEIINGREMARAFKETQMFPSLVIRMINLGETTGNLESALGKVTQYYDREIPDAIEALLAGIKPVMMIFAAGLIVIVAMGIVLPFFGMMSAIHA